VRSEEAKKEAIKKLEEEIKKIDEALKECEISIEKDMDMFWESLQPH
jgi:flagellar hook-associated protein FlgK